MFRFVRKEIKNKFCDFYIYLGSTQVGIFEFNSNIGWILKALDISKAQNYILVTDEDNGCFVSWEEANFEGLLKKSWLYSVAMRQYKDTLPKIFSGRINDEIAF